MPPEDAPSPAPEPSLAPTPLPASIPAVRLLPLVENSPNEKLANTLAHLLAPNENDAEPAAQWALLILTGIQAYYDTGGNYLAVERLWAPIILSRQLADGPEAWKKAMELAKTYRAAGNLRASALYEQAAAYLKPADVNKSVDPG